MASCWPSCYSPDCLSLAIGLLNAAIGLLNAPRIIMEVENDGKWPHMSLYEYVVNFTCTLIPGREKSTRETHLTNGCKCSFRAVHGFYACLRVPASQLRHVEDVLHISCQHIGCTQVAFVCTWFAPSKTDLKCFHRRQLTTTFSLVGSSNAA